jgi:hypothetical protein
MKMKLLVALAGAAVVAAATAPVVAHHAFAADYDANRPVTLNGKVTKVEWVNPHAWIHLKTESGEDWMVEGAAPNTLLRRGINRTSLMTGTDIVVDGYQSKDGSLRANGRAVTLPDGRRLFMGSSGTGAPRDGVDPKETRR